MRLLGLFQSIDKIFLKVFQALGAKLGFFVNEGLEGYGEVGQKKHKFFGFSQEGRRQKLSATPDLSGTVLPLCLIPNSALKSAPPFKSVV
ncbi:hypothetical protein, partial [Pseudomonas aeruginosa]|uniref:hypothetical protein n=1 Tax=Pseudomonas aeruginosa TaxID=287 RepID=UPI0039836C3F